MNAFSIFFMFGVPAVLITGAITHFVIGDFTEATLIVGVLAGVFSQQYASQSEGKKGQADG